MATQTRARLSARTRALPSRKAEVRALRREGRVPATLYGHGEPLGFSVERRELADLLGHHAAGGILDLEIDGKTGRALLREIDRDPVTGEVIALGFQRVRLNETVRAALPILFTGEETLLREGLVLQRQLEALEVQGRAGRLPEAITVDVSGSHDLHAIRVGDLELPDGIEPLKDPDLPVATISAPSVPADVAAALDAEEAAIAAREAGLVEQPEETAEEAASA